VNGLAQGRVNPARDAARAAKRSRFMRGEVPKDTEFEVFWDEQAGAWQAMTNRGDPSSVRGFGATPVSAMIAAELALFKRAR